MSRKAGDECTFRQRDLKAAIRAARAAGLENFRIDIDKRTGVISVVPLTAGETRPQQQGTSSEWDDDL
jgi:hypothetical protein